MDFLANPMVTWLQPAHFRGMNRVGSEVLSVRSRRNESSWGPLPSALTLPLFSPQADLKNQLGDAGYVVFGVVLFVWELLPTTLVVYFFRVRNPARDLVSKPFDICRGYRWNFSLDFSIERLFHPDGYKKFPYLIETVIPLDSLLREICFTV